MERARLVKLIGTGMVGLGLVQAGWGTLRGDAIYAVLGIAYASIGVAYLYFEGDGPDQ